MAPTKELKAYQHERKEILDRMDRIHVFINNFNPKTQNISSIKTRQTIVMSTFKEFMEVQAAIEEHISSAELETETKDRVNFENIYFEIAEKIEQLIEKSNEVKVKVHDAGGSSKSGQSPPIEHKGKINLPVLQLPEFTGNYAEWLNFRDTYKAVIHENKTLSPIEKLHYLRSSLKGDALRAIESVAVTSENYATAWSLLEKRYENKRLIVHHHVKNILNAVGISKATADSLRKLLDQVKNNIESIKVFQIAVEYWDAILVPIICEKLDFQTRKEWQIKLTAEIPTYEELVTFLDSRCQYLESLNYETTQFHVGQPQKNHFKSSKFVATSHHVAASQQSSRNSCSLCKKSNHFIHQCSKFLKQTITERLNQITNLNLCENCLKSGHKVDTCRSTSTCKYCHLKHNSLIHTEQQNPIVNHCRFNINRFENLLSTAIIFIKDRMGCWQKCRALLDNGSQLNFITQELCLNLNLPAKQVQHSITGINMVSKRVNSIISTVVKSTIDDFQMGLDCYVLDQITNNLPLRSFPKNQLDIPKNIQLADENFNVSSKIDLLIGSNLFLKLLTSGKIQVKPFELYLQNSAFGWIIGGALGIHNDNNLSACNLAVKPYADLDKQIAKFWEIEGTDAYENPSSKCIIDPAENHFKETFCRNAEGRFIVSLPAKGKIISLGDSYQTAKRRFLSLEKKFNRDCQLRENYAEFIKEYENLGHLERVPESELLKPNVYYIPHHAVYKDAKIRVVFDASAKTSNKLSLNDNLLAGETIQQSLLSIITRFRTFNIILKADVCKMFRQILVNPSQTDYQRILWRDDPNKILETYRLLTVTYGVKSSPFLAVRVLQQLALEARDQFPEAAEIILRDFYMDDLITGADSINVVLKLKSEISQILKRGGFELAKFASNESEVLTEEASNAVYAIPNDSGSYTKTLGLFWHCKDDILGFSVEQITTSQNLTKRNILSIMCKIYDPLGLVSPVIVRAKMILQDLWKSNLSWDEPVPTEIKDAWLNLVNDLRQLRQVKVPRKIVIPNSQILEIHGFADSSQKAYGAALYLKGVTSDGQVYCNLLVAKSRIAPLKLTTIPRLELLAALLLARLFNQSEKILNLNIGKTYLYTDSQIVLAWLAKPAYTWQTFVANRVEEIQTLTQNATWLHVSTKENPADLISRGTSTENLINNKLWLNGPSFLTKHQEQSDFSITNKYLEINFEEVPEKRKNTAAVLNVTVNSEFDLITKYSDVAKLKRIVAWILRFINNCKNTAKIRDKNLTLDEISAAHTKLVKLVQQEVFLNELRDLQLDGVIKKSSSLLSLSPFLDKDGIIRVGGRLSQSKYSFDKKYPIVLPKSHCFTTLIVRKFHEIQLHAGAQATLASIRQVYWIIAGRSVVRSVLHKCVPCFRTRPIVATQKMGDLPIQRLEPVRPFYKCGVDYCGPFQIKESRGRGKKTVKAYIALFICLCTKAIHLELVSDLTTDGFLNALRRFMSRRGQVKQILSDNAKCFVGSNNELISLFHNESSKNKIINKLAEQNIRWQFIPPRSPNFGGIWESNIKGVKIHIKKVLGETRLTWEEMYTLLVRIEACLNSRPLLPLSSDPNDLNALTPGHFIIGESLTAPIETNLEEIKVNKLSRWQLTEQIRQHFWKRWSREYISQLQPRSKWRTESSPVQPGVMVLLKEDNTSPLQWPLGRVQDVHPGSDGLVRVVTVKTAKGLFKRGITKVCVLPVN